MLEVAASITGVHCLERLCRDLEESAASVLAFAFLSRFFTLEKACSMGFP